MLQYIEIYNNNIPKTTFKQCFKNACEVYLYLKPIGSKLIPS